MAGLSLLLVLVVVLAGVLGWATLHGGDGGAATRDGADGADGQPFVVPPVTAPAVRVQPVAAGEVLTRLARDLRTGTRAAAVTLAGDDAPTATRLGDLVDTVAAAHLVDVTFRYVDEQGGLDADGTWRAAVDTTWRFARFDQAPAEAEVSFAFRATAAGVRIVAVGGPTLRTPVWMSGPTQVARGRDTLVLVAGTAPRLARYVGFARRAVPVVRRVVTTWTPRLVLEVPVDLDALDRALAQPAGSDSAIAALASSVDGSAAPGTPVHVLVNSDVFDRLPRLGAQVVMSHETTHIATDAYRSRAPTWLKEGIADFVALRDVRLPLSRTAAQVAAQVRQDGLPRGLPTSTDFDPRAPHLGAVYEAAWLVCVTLADRGGQQALLRLYDRTSTGAALGPALESLFGWSTADLVTAWRSRLSHLPG